MSITARTRKTLWGKAGGRCSICHEQVVIDATHADDDLSVVGQECHIVAQSPGGPRAAKITDLDGYENLILLCSKHHKQVDDQRTHFTVERLKKIKSEHEKQEASRRGPVRMIPDPAKPAAKVLKLCVSGEDLWQSVNGAYLFYPSYPAGLNDDQADAVDDLLDELNDWLQVAGELSYREGRNAARALGDHILRLGGLGLLVCTRDRYLLMTGGVSGETSRWRSFDIQIQPFTEARVADATRTRLIDLPLSGNPAR